MKSGLVKHCCASGGHALPEWGKVGRGRRTRRQMIGALSVAFPLLSGSATAEEVDPANLSRLHDIVIPDAVSWWPPGPAWAVVAYLLAAVLLVLGIRVWRSWKADRYRRLALRELAEIESVGLSETAIGAIPALLKRTALAAFGRQAVASLSGEAWYRFLEGSSPSFRMADKPAGFFMSSAYTSDLSSELTEQEHAAIVRATRTWIRSHRVDREISMGVEKT